MPQKKRQLSKQKKELPQQRFVSMVSKFYSNKPDCHTCFHHGFSSIEVWFTSPDNKKCHFGVSLEYFQNNQQEIYDLLKNPFETEKEGLVCSLSNP